MRRKFIFFFEGLKALPNLKILLIFSSPLCLEAIIVVVKSLAVGPLHVRRVEPKAPPHRLQVAVAPVKDAVDDSDALGHRKALADCEERGEGLRLDALSVGVPKPTKRGRPREEGAGHAAVDEVRGADLF